MYSYLANSGSGTNYGLYLTNSSSGSGTEYGVYVTGEERNYFSGDIGVGTNNPDSKLAVDGRIHSVHSTAGQAGLWLEHNGSTSVGNWGIYQEGNNATMNYFEGMVGIGSTPIPTIPSK